MVGPQEVTSSSLCINDTAVMKRVNMKKGDILLEMGRCLKNVLIDGDPKQLFQRLVVAGKETVDTQILFTYELSSYPTSLFDQSPDASSRQSQSPGSLD